MTVQNVTEPKTSGHNIWNKTYMQALILWRGCDLSEKPCKVWKKVFTILFQSSGKALAPIAIAYIGNPQNVTRGFAWYNWALRAADRNPFYVARVVVCRTLKQSYHNFRCCVLKPCYYLMGIQNCGLAYYDSEPFYTISDKIYSSNSQMAQIQVQQCHPHSQTSSQYKWHWWWEATAWDDPWSVPI